MVFLRDSWWIGADSGSAKVRTVEKFPRVSLILEDGRFPVVAEGEAVLHRGRFPESVTDVSAAKYGWDVSAPRTPGGDHVLLEVPVRRRLLVGVTQ